MTTSKLVKTHLPCPNCSSSDGYSIADDGHGFCFVCNERTPAANEHQSYFSSDFTYQYVARRGISEAAHRFYDVKAKINSEGEPIAVGYKYPSGFTQIKTLDKKGFYQEGEVKAGLFGRDKFAAGGSRYVTVTEGNDDALAIHDVLQGPVVAVQSSSSAVRDCTADRDWLNSFERIYFAFDADTPGRDALSKVARLFDYNKVFHVKFTNRKDATEYVEHGESQQLKNIWWNSKKYLPETIVSSFSDFEKILTEPRPKSIPYPYPTLTDMTYGIRFGESVLITAPEGVGKTEIMHAIEYQILRETDDAIGAIFLEEPKKRHLQAVAGLDLQVPVHLPDSGVTDAETFAALQRIVGTDDRLHVYSHFGSDDPDVILDAIRFLVSARSCRYVLLDHITMVVSGLGGEEERKALDYLSTRLEMMVKELDFALILVSHVNDNGQTRGSRYIGKVCDIRIDLDRDLLHPDAYERSIMRLTVSKNRFSGKTGPAGILKWNFKKSMYTEDVGFASPVAANDNLFPEAKNVS